MVLFILYGYPLIGLTVGWLDAQVQIRHTARRLSGI